MQPIDGIKTHEIVIMYFSWQCYRHVLQMVIGWTDTYYDINSVSQLSDGYWLLYVSCHMVIGWTGTYYDINRICQHNCFYSSSSMALQLWKSLGLLDNSLLLRAVLYLFCHFTSAIFFRSFLTSSSHLDLCLPADLPVNGFHLCILFTMPVSGILFVCPNQLNRWALT